MNKVIVMAALACVAGLSQAAEYGKVISSTPVMQEVLIPQRTCRDEQVEVEQPKNPAGSVIGAVAGGLLGSTMGRGSGNAAATAAGVIVGAVVGDQAANANSGTTTRTERRCSTQQVRSQQLAGYDVVYEYAGKRYTTRMAKDPGDSIPLQISPIGSAVSSAPVVSIETVVEEEPVRIVRRVEPVYAPPVVLHWDLWPGPGPGFGHPPRW
jgi:uncharacterized protein YcfJ